MAKKSNKSSINITIESYRLAYTQYGDIWEGSDEDYFNPATNFLIHSLPEGSLILDQGCGTGYLILRCAMRGHSIEGFDISPEAIELCRRRFAEKNIDSSIVKLLIQDLRDFEYPKTHYNGIIDYYTLHHFPKSFQKVIIRKIYHALKPSGLFLLGMFSKAQFPKTTPLISTTKDGGVSVPFKYGRRVFYLWDTNHLESFIESTGFRLILTYRGVKYHSCEIICQKTAD
ncbi:MAG: class I SAM-dependent methyltransferase [Candidatus Hodarchaeota archaeon]